MGSVMFPFQLTRCGLVLTLMLLGCTSSKHQLFPQMFPATVPGPAGEPVEVPVALWVKAARASPSDEFVAHHFVEQAGRYFTHRVHVFDETSAAGKTLVVLEALGGAFESGFITGTRTVTLKGYVQRPGEERIAIEGMHTVVEELPASARVAFIVAPALYYPALCSLLTLVLTTPGFIAYVMSDVLGAHANGALLEAQQSAIDEVCAGAVAALLENARAVLSMNASAVTRSGM